MKFGIVLLLLSLELCLLLNLSFTQRDNNYLLAASREQAPLGEIVRGLRIRQKFTVKTDNFSALAISMATWGRENTSTLELKLFEKENLITSEILDASKIKDNSFLTLDFPARENSKDGKYELVLSSPNAVMGNAVTAWVNAEAVEGAELYADENLLAGNISIVPVYDIKGSDFLAEALRRMSVNTIKAVTPTALACLFIALLFLLNLVFVELAFLLLSKNMTQR